MQDALKPVRDFLAALGGQVKVVELDAESPAGEKRIKDVGLKGHVPIVLLINGSDKFKRPDGTAVEFKDFPAGARQSARAKRHLDGRRFRGGGEGDAGEINVPVIHWRYV